MNKISEKEMAKQKKDFGHEIKENTELTEHETGINDVKKNAKSAFNKMKEGYIEISIKLLQHQSRIY